MYTKNLEQLLRLLQFSRKSGLLIVEDAVQGEVAWQGRIRLTEGKMVACQVRIQAGATLNKDEALRWMMARTRLNWELEEGDQLPDTLLPALPPASGPAGEGRNLPQVYTTGKREAVHPVPNERASWVPRRTQKGRYIPIQTLRPLEYLQVFTLVNGHNSVEGITRLLRKTPAEISRILNDLRSAGLIE